MALSRFRYARNLGAMLLLLLFTEYLGSTSLFMHSHRIDGQLIVHSHPYSGSADSPNHSHSAQQCKAIGLLSSFTALAAGFVLPSLAAAATVCIMAVRRAAATHLTSAIIYGLRAPPAAI